MKVGNVILAIFLWLCIPAAFFFGFLFGIFTFNPFLLILFAFGLPILFFILGLVVLLSGREKETYRKIETRQPDRICLQCGRAIPVDANICPYCGKSLYSPEKQKTEPSATVEELRENKEINKLINKIHQGKYQERIDSIKALGALGDKTAVEPLLEIIKQRPRDESTVPLILKALGEIGDSSTIEPLTGIRKNTSKHLDKNFADTIQSLSSAKKPQKSKKKKGKK